jgi:hypothetical protein
LTFPVQALYRWSRKLRTHRTSTFFTVLLENRLVDALCFSKALGDEGLNQPAVARAGVPGRTSYHTLRPSLPLSIRAHRRHPLAARAAAVLGAGSADRARLGVRSRSRFRNRGTEYVGGSAIKWMSRSCKATMRPSPQRAMSPKSNRAVPLITVSRSTTQLPGHSSFSCGIS